MASNMVHTPGNQLEHTLASVVSGDPVMVGQLPGVALISTDADGKVTVKHDGVFRLSVKGENNAGNVAVAVGDILYHEAAATPKINKDSTAGIRFGYALEAIASGATATIKVKVGY